MKNCNKIRPKAHTWVTFSTQAILKRVHIRWELSKNVTQFLFLIVRKIRFWSHQCAFPWWFRKVLEKELLKLLLMALVYATCLFWPLVNTLNSFHSPKILTLFSKRFNITSPKAPQPRCTSSPHCRAFERKQNDFTSQYLMITWIFTYSRSRNSLLYILQTTLRNSMVGACHSYVMAFLKVLWYIWCQECCKRAIQYASVELTAKMSRGELFCTFSCAINNTYVNNEKGRVLITCTLGYVRPFCAYDCTFRGCLVCVHWVHQHRTIRVHCERERKWRE